MRQNLRIFQRYRTAVMASLALLPALAVHPQTVHLATGKPAAQSSTFEEAAAGLAVDGNANGNYPSGSVALTHRDPYPYWWVDLGAPTDVGSVTVHGRTDAHANRPDHFILTGLPAGAAPPTDEVLSTLARKQLTDSEALADGWLVHRSKEQFTAAHANESVPFEGTFRYLYVMLPRADYLQLAEVEVHPPGDGALQPTSE